MACAPIALFVYNRPLHTCQTVEALKKNDLSKDSDLIVFSDAPKSEAQAEAVNQVRQYIRQIDGFKSLTIVERDTNFGLARSIIDGVTVLCNQYGRVIVLEDDLVMSPHFLKFMNDALDTYADVEQVMHISGAAYPIESMEGDTYFLRVPLCWGWGTWDRAWRHYRKSNDVMNEFDQKMRSDFNFHDAYPYWNQLENNAKGLINTWFVYWYATLFLRKGLALFPARSLVRNIGMDGSGVHCGEDQGYDAELSSSAIRVLPIPLGESDEAVRRHVTFFRKLTLRPSLPLRIYNKAVRTFGKLWSLLGIAAEGKR